MYAPLITLGRPLCLLTPQQISVSDLRISNVGAAWPKVSLRLSHKPLRNPPFLDQRSEFDAHNLFEKISLHISLVLSNAWSVYS